MERSTQCLFKPTKTYLGNTMSNDNLVLICGESSTGKSASLRNLENPEGVVYLNCESGKKTPFPNKFKNFTITDPYQVHQAFDELQNNDTVHTIVIDGLNYLMDMFESLYIIGSSDSRNGWSDYAQFFKTLMQEKVAKSNKNIIFTAHTRTIYNETSMAMETKVPIKGALANQGIESYFSSIVACKKVRLKDLEKYQSDLLHITEDEELLGFKYVFQTKLTADTVQERIRNPMGLFSNQETFIDNDAQLLLNRFHEYYQ